MIAWRICSKHKDLVHEVSGKLAEDAITDMVRKAIKKWSSAGPEAQKRIKTPGLDVYLVQRLPASISIPVENDMMYRPMTMATVDELRQHIVFLMDQIQKDTDKLRILQEALDRAKFVHASGDMKVIDALQIIVNQAA